MSEAVVLGPLAVPLSLLLASSTSSRYFIFPITKWGLDWWQKTFNSLEIRALFQTSISIALIVTVMVNNGLNALASLDADFDRVPGITRYAPV